MYFVGLFTSPFLQYSVFPGKDILLSVIHYICTQWQAQPEPRGESTSYFKQGYK